MITRSKCSQSMVVSADEVALELTQVYAESFPGSVLRKKRTQQKRQVQRTAKGSCQPVVP
jgi:hypothetical protein